MMRGKYFNIVSEVLKKNSKSVEDYKTEKESFWFFLVGQVMKETGGKADPKIVNEVLKKKLEKVLIKISC